MKREKTAVNPMAIIHGKLGKELSNQKTVGAIERI